MMKPIELTLLSGILSISLPGVCVNAKDLNAGKPSDNLTIKVGLSRRPCCWYIGDTPRDTFPNFPTTLDIQEDLQNYKRWMLVRISENWIPLKCRAGIEATVTVDRLGKLIDCKITRLSSLHEMNTEALRAVKIAQFDSFPPSWTTPQQTFKIEFNDVEYFPPTKKNHLRTQTIYDYWDVRPNPFKRKRKLENSK